MQPDDRIMFKAFMASLRQVEQKTFAARIGISQQYLCDLRKERRKWNPQILDRVLSGLHGITQSGRDAIHRHCARSAGWRV